MLWRNLRLWTVISNKSSLYNEIRLVEIVIKIYIFLYVLNNGLFKLADYKKRAQDAIDAQGTIDKLQSKESLTPDEQKALSEAKKKKENSKMSGKDYADMAVGVVGLATNFMGQVYQSQLNVVDAELKNLEIRKQLAKTDEERQKIDEEILEKQKQQIDLQYKQSTQTMGITGVAGSALGSAMSGAMAGAMIGGESGGAYGAMIGGGLGLIGGIFGGSSAKKQAEQQKAQLEAQLRTNQYLETMQKLQEANNNLMKSVFDSMQKGIKQAMKDAFEEFKQANVDKGTFKYTKGQVGLFNKSSTGLEIAKALGINTTPYTTTSVYQGGSTTTVYNKK